MVYLGGRPNTSDAGRKQIYAVHREPGLGGEPGHDVLGPERYAVWFVPIVTGTVPE